MKSVIKLLMIILIKKRSIYTTCGKNHLKKRKDDSKEAIITRYDTYMKETKPVLDFYSSKSYFHEIDGSQKIEVITGKIEHIINV